MKHSNPPSPPRPAEWIIKRLRRYRLNHAIIEDMHETFTRINREKGVFRARLWYWGQCLDALLKNTTFDFSWSFSMIKNYIKISFRHIRRHKGFSFINTAGLAVGICCCILILQYIRYEFSFDKFHENAMSVFRVLQQKKGDKSQDSKTINSVPVRKPQRLDKTS